MSGNVSVDHQSSVILESLLHLRCESGNNVDVHKATMCRNSPPVSIIHISRNSDDESLSSILIFVALALYYDKFFVTPGKSISYPFVSIIFYHAFSIDVGHCNFTLFSCDGKIFGDAFVTENLYHNKLVVVESSATWLAHTK